MEYYSFFTDQVTPSTEIKPSKMPADEVEPLEEDSAKKSIELCDNATKITGNSDSPSEDNKANGDDLKQNDTGQNGRANSDNSTQLDNRLQNSEESNTKEASFAKTNGELKENSTHQDTCTSSSKRKADTDLNDENSVEKNKRLKISNEIVRNGVSMDKVDCDSDSSLAIDEPQALGDEEEIESLPLCQEEEVESVEEVAAKPKVLEPHQETSEGKDLVSVEDINDETKQKENVSDRHTSENIEDEKDSKIDNSNSVSKYVPSDNLGFACESLNLECVSEPLSDVQKARFSMVSADFEKVFDIVKTSLGSSKVRKYSLYMFIFTD